MSRKGHLSCYEPWMRFILVWAIYSSVFTPVEFGLLRGLPQNLFFLDIVCQIAFLIDIILRFIVAYHDPYTCRMVYKRSSLALRYLKGDFVIDFLGCLPWDAIYKACGHKKGVRYFLWIRLSRVWKVKVFLQKMEKDIRINWLFTRKVKLVVIELYWIHTTACFLGSTVRIFEYFGGFCIFIVSMGYGNVHDEMVFIANYVSFCLIFRGFLDGYRSALKRLEVEYEINSYS